MDLFPKYIQESLEQVCFRARLKRSYSKLNFVLQLLDFQHFAGVIHRFAKLQEDNLSSPEQSISLNAVGDTKINPKIILPKGDNQEDKI